MIAALKHLFSPDPAKACAHNAYLSIVAQARRPDLYQHGVPDTLDGRFDMLVMHLSLIMDRLAGEPPTSERQAFLRALQEWFFADMDRSLREMGAGDTGVGKRVKSMAKAFYGRIRAYGDEEALEDALLRNVWRGQAVSDASLTWMANYVRRNREALRAQPASALLQGNVAFLR